MGGIVPRGSAAGDGMWFCGHGGGTELCGAVGYGVEEWGAHLGPFGGTPDLSLLLWLSWDVRPRCATPQSPLTSPNDRPGLGSVSSVPQRPLLFPIHWLRSPSRCPPPLHCRVMGFQLFSGCRMGVWGPPPSATQPVGPVWDFRKALGTSASTTQRPAGPCGASWGSLGASLGPWGDFRGLLGAVGGFRGLLGGLLGVVRGSMGAFLGPWGTPWGREGLLGAVRGSVGGSLGLWGAP